MNKKTIALLIVTCFLTISINQCIAHPESSIGSQEVGEDTLCYGLIASPVKCENATIQDQIGCKIRHMINDLLREQIPVYWTAEDVDASIIEINGSEEETVSFEKGTFIIPFTGNTSVDTKIIVIMCDYNYSSEIEEDNELKISVYILREPLSNVHVYPLSEVKLAQHKSPITVGEICFLEISSECGFLSFELLIDSVIAEKLNNNEFNVLTHAGGVPDYATFYKIEPPTMVFYALYSDLKYRVSTAVRKFVSNGSGYIGSCYGADVAGSGHKFGPVTIHFKRVAYNPKLPSIVYYGLADYISLRPHVDTEQTQVKIVNDTHPVSYRLGEVTWEYNGGGPGFDRIGENTQVIGEFCNTDTELDGRPCWVSSKFGKGRAVAFSRHPEILGFGFYKSNRTHIGRTVISNALFYTTAKEMTALQLSHMRSLSFIEEILAETGDIQIDTNTVDIFNETKNAINETIEDITNLSDYVKQLEFLIGEIADEKKINLNELPTFLGDNSLHITVKYYYHLFVKYLENTMETLNTLEKIYPLLESDPEFVKQIETLKADISSRIAEIRKICTQGYEMCEDYEKALLNYQQHPLILSRVKEFLLTDKGHKFYWHIYSVFSYVPQIYFNSLKLLRNSWYNYEASMMEL
ncbi:MAG: hypothetical protein KAW45_05095 [Thermoplasmatales archaeon]|nr:hypothetical protein [Thermoplasmatales archaeon]